MDVLEKTYFETHAAEMLKEKLLTKTAFAEKMGVKAQNVNKVFETKNVCTLKKVAQVLDVSLDYLINGSNTEDNETPIYGFIEINGVVHRIRSRVDIEKVLELL